MEHNAWGGHDLGWHWPQLHGPVFFQGLRPGRVNGVTAQRYIDQILQPHVVPFFHAHPNFIFQQDNARAHSARVTQDFLHQQNIQTMVQPAMSLDLNPIEHFWDMLQRELNSVRPRPMTSAQLQQAIIQSWNNILRASANRLVHSMRRMCQDVIDANGGHTR